MKRTMNKGEQIATNSLIIWFYVIYIILLIIAFSHIPSPFSEILFICFILAAFSILCGLVYKIYSADKSVYKLRSLIKFILYSVLVIYLCLDSFIKQEMSTERVIVVIISIIESCSNFMERKVNGV